MTDAAGPFAGLTIARGAPADRRSAGSARPAARAPAHRPDRSACTSAAIRRWSISWRQQWFIRVLDLKERAAGGRRAGALASRAHAGALPRLGGEPELGLVHLPPALLRRALPGLVLPGLRRVVLADEASCRSTRPSAAASSPCACGSTRVHPETDVMDTWATSSLTPQIVGRWLAGHRELYRAGLPLLAAPAGARDHPHLGVLHHRQVALPLRHAALDRRAHLRLGAGRRGHGQDQQEPRRRADGAPGDDRTLLGGRRCATGRPAPAPARMRSSARRRSRWAPSWSPSCGTWPASRDVSCAGDRRRISTAQSDLHARRPLDPGAPAAADPAGQRTLSAYDYAAAKSEVEAFFWRDLADNYLEMAKQRLYAPEHPGHGAPVTPCDRRC